MTTFDNNSAQLVKDAADIIEIIGEHVTLQKHGGGYKGLCPFHSEKTPSFSVNQTRQYYHCFGCKESGDVFSFIMKYHNLTFPEALQELAQRYGITLQEGKLSPAEEQRARKREVTLQANGQAAELFHEFLCKNPAAGEARQYLENRGISEKIIKHYQLGFAPDSWDFLSRKLSRNPADRQAGMDAGLLVAKDNRCYDRFRKRIVCPIFSMSGQITGFGGRIVGDGQPKYLNTPETQVFDKSRLLFGLFHNKKAIQKAGNCLVVEGNFDMLTLADHGLDHVVAPLGTALSQHHIRLLKRYTPEVVMLFDGDEAGIKAAMRSVTLFLNEQLNGRVVTLPPDQDPDSFIRENGSRALEKRIANAVSLPEFVFTHLASKHGLDLQGKNRIVKELEPVIKALDNNQLQQTLFVSHFSEKLGIPATDLQGYFKKPPSKPSKPKAAPTKLPVLSVQHRQFLEFILAYPDTLDDFIRAGIAEVFDPTPGSKLILQLETIARTDPLLSPDSLLANLEEPYRTLIAGLLVSVPHYAEDSKDTMTREMGNWLKQKIIKKQKARLLARINEAQQQGDDSLLLTLLSQKAEIDQRGHHDR